MKSDLWILIKSNFQQMWGSMRYSKRRKKYIPAALLIILGGGALLAMMTINAISMTYAFSEMGQPEGGLYYAISQAMGMALLFSVMRGGMANTTNDADFLLSMPLRRSTILLSKSISRYLFDFLIVGGLTLPGVVCYFVMIDHSVLTLLRGILVVLMIPLFSVGLAYILSYLLFKLSARMKNPQHIRTVLLLVVTVGFLMITMSMSGGIASSNGMAGFAEKFPPFIWGAEFAVFGNLRAFALFFLLTVAPFALGIWLQGLIYGAKQTGWRSTDKTLSFQLRSPFAALFSKEMKFYFSIPIYVLNTIFGPVMAIMAAVALVVAKSQVLGFLYSEPEFASMLSALPIALLCVFCFFPGMTCISACSISLEGKNIRILRASPLLERDVFRSKLAVHAAVAIPALLLCTVVACLTLNVGFLNTLLIVLNVLGISILMDVWGLYANLLFPKLQWDNETQVVKQSVAVMLTILPGMVLAVLPLILYTVFGGNFVVSALFSLLVFVVLSALSYLLLVYDGSRRYREL